MSERVKLLVWFVVGCTIFFGLEAIASAAASGAAGVGGIGAVADTVRTNFSPIAKLITAGAYLAGFGFGVGAIVKFKAHKDNPTQIPISQPIALLFVAAALLTIPSVFGSAGRTLYSGAATANSLSGVDKIS